MKFDPAVEIVLEHEGGKRISRDPRDPGGLTKWGISQRSFPDLDIENLTKNQAKTIYKMQYWDKVVCDELPARYRLMVFDTAVNMGVARATTMLQSLLKVKPDGKIGPVTLAATRSTYAQEILDAYTVGRIILYTKMSHFKVYRRGWVWRTIECYKYCMMSDFLGSVDQEKRERVQEFLSDAPHKKPTTKLH